MPVFFLRLLWRNLKLHRENELEGSLHLAECLQNSSHYGNNCPGKLSNLCSQKSPHLSSCNCSFQSGSSTDDVTVIALKSSGKNLHKEEKKASQKQWARGNRGRRSRVSGALPAPSTCCPEVFSLLYLYCSQPCFLVSEAHLLVSWAAVTVPCRIACCWGREGSGGAHCQWREKRKEGRTGERREGRRNKDPAGGPQHLPSSSVCSAVTNRDKLGAYQWPRLKTASEWGGTLGGLCQPLAFGTFLDARLLLQQTQWPTSHGCCTPASI